MARSVAKLKMGFYPLPVSEGAIFVSFSASQDRHRWSIPAWGKEWLST